MKMKRNERKEKERPFSFIANYGKKKLNKKWNSVGLFLSLFFFSRQEKLRRRSCFRGFSH